MANMEKEAAVTPRPPRWIEYTSGIPSLGRKLRVAQICAGVDCGEAEHSLGLQIDACNVYDLEPGYKDVMAEVLWTKHGCRPKLHFGRQVGDVTKVRLEDLEGPVDLIKGGPPCPPWSSR